ncbi:hypothetical protein M404DRAFT_168700, partial [Pisolithus tinctorius Marx 270]
YLQVTQLLSRSINQVLHVIDPGFYAKITHLREVVEEKFPAVKAFNRDDPLLFEGREIIFNRKSGPHVDRQDPQMGWVALVALGEFTGGNLHCPQLGLDVRLEPGDVILLRGRVVRHQIKDWDEEQRIVIAHFTHTCLWEAAGLEKQVSI